MRWVSLLILTVIGIGNVGCQNRGELMSYREAVNTSIQPKLEEHDQQSSVIAGDNNKDGVVTAEDGEINLQQLPNLSSLTPEQRTTWLRARLGLTEEYKKTYQESKAQDASGSLFGPKKPPVPDPIQPSE